MALCMLLKKVLKKASVAKVVTCFKETCLPPRPTRRRANPRQRRGAERLVREYRNRGSHDPPSSSLHHGQPPLWSKRAWGEKQKKNEMQNYFVYTTLVSEFKYQQGKLLKHKWTTKCENEREKSTTYRVVNTSSLPSESKSSIGIILFFSLWWPRMHLHEASKKTKRV